jgi:hypothetical protein
MTIPRKRILERIAGKRKAIEYHLDSHIPDLLATANRELLEYWNKEVGSHISDMEQWANRLKKNQLLLAEANEFRRRLAEILGVRREQLDKN